MRREEWKKHKGHKETFGGEEYVHYRDYSDSDTFFIIYKLYKSVQIFIIFKLHTLSTHNFPLCPNKAVCKNRGKLVV